ncbi:CocE/NonD family hydrolase [Paenibacillus sp. NPDC056722]|uniref:CocE/NonD family hydrolase n=1 Tax=Paenibacillus sp. NPDC056722 TaxID=3345924 RepID=UPI003683AF20
MARIGAAVVERNVPVPMRDGTLLYADVYRPESEGLYPVLLLRTAYNKEDAQTMNYAHPSWYARQGYIVVVQDVRGRWASEGEFHPNSHEEEDGYDTVQWASALSGALPKVGMYGFSYCGAVQWQAALARPPALICIAPGMIGSDTYQGKTYRNGAFALASLLSWALFVAQDTALDRGRSDWAGDIPGLYAGIHSLYGKLPLKNLPGPLEALVPFYKEWLEHPEREEYWLPSSLKEQYQKIAVPALHIGGWYDLFIDGTIENYNGVRQHGATQVARENQQLYIEPWFHMPWSRYVGDLDFGPEAANRVDALQLQWFDRWLKGKVPQERETAEVLAASEAYAVHGRSKAIKLHVTTNAHESFEEHKSHVAPELSQAPIQFFLMGSNSWRQAEEWPLPGARITDYYLHNTHKANSINGDGRLDTVYPTDEYPDVYVYHPSIPVPALGGRSGAVPDLTPMGPKNQIPVELRNDVLVYTSEPLTRELTVIGEIVAVLFVSSSAEDTDIVAKLVDVYPDGRAFNVAEGILRVSYRNGLERRDPIVPGEVMELHLSLGPTAIVFLPGHAIRLDVTSSLFPTFDRNPNRLLNPGEVTEGDFVTATQTLFHDNNYPSRLKLPIIGE